MSFNYAWPSILCSFFASRPHKLHLGPENPRQPLISIFQVSSLSWFQFNMRYDYNDFQCMLQSALFETNPMDDLQVTICKKTFLQNFYFNFYRYNSTTLHYRLTFQHLTHLYNSPILISCRPFNRFKKNFPHNMKLNLFFNSAFNSPFNSTR